MAKVNITVLADQVQARIKELQAAGSNMSQAWRAAGISIVNRIRLGFRMGRDPWGNTWQPIKWRAPRISAKGGITKAGRRQRQANFAGTPGQPLVDTGRLRRSIVERAQPNSVTVGTNLIYARVHQFGARIKAKKGPFLVFAGPDGAPLFVRQVTIPARPFMPINQAGQPSLPATWAANIIRTLAAHFKLGSGSPQVSA